MRLTHDELAAEIYAVLRKRPHGYDLEVSQECAREVARAEATKAQEERG